MSALAFKKGLPSLLRRGNYDAESIVNKLTIPSLIIHGSQDPLIYVSRANKLADALIDGKLIELNCGHNCPFQVSEIAELVFTQH